MQKKAKKVANGSNQKPLDFILCIIIFLLLALGIVMVLSASAPFSLSNYGNSYYFVVRQAGFAAAGIVLMLFISKIDYHIYKKFYKIAYWVAIITLMLVVVPGLSRGAKGATRWVELGPISFQPSEIAKICLIIFYAGYLSDHRNELGHFWKGCIKSYIPLVPPILILYFLQDHLSAAIVIIAVTSIMMIMSGIKMRHFLSFGTVAGSVAVMRNVITCKNKRKRRLPFSQNYIILRSLGRFIRKWISGNTRTLCNRLRRSIWSRFRAKQAKILIYTRTT